MSAHTKASQESTGLCDQLFECLSAKIPNLQRGMLKTWCSLYQADRNRFAYISHRKKQSHIQIWCLGNAVELQQSTTLNIVPRERIRGGWEERFQARFNIDNHSEIEAACKLLYEVSYKLS